MGNLRYAALDGTDLPVQFHYDPPVPPRRSNTIQTAGAVVRQVATAIVDQDAMIAWTCLACCLSEYTWFLDKFNQDGDPTMAFTGYWGDAFTVKFHALDPPQVQGRLFSLAGSLQIVTVTTWHS